MIRADAINNVLRRIGHLHMQINNSAIASSNNPETWASRFLDDADIACQSRGWNFNKRSNVKLSPIGGVIAKPDCFRIDTSGESSNINITVQGGNLFNSDDNTATFTTDIYVDYYIRVGWTDLPETFAAYIVSEAAFAFNRYWKKDQALDSMLKEEIAKRWVECKREDNDQADINLLDTSEMNQLRGRPKMIDRSTS